MALAGEIASWPARTVTSESSVAAAAEVMRSDGIGDVLVVDARGRLTGVLTDRDVVLRVVAEARDPRTTAVWDVCTRDPVAVDAMAEVEDAARLMRERVLHRVAVVDDAGIPTGIISIEDLAASDYGDGVDVVHTLRAIATAYRARARSVAGW